MGKDTLLATTFVAILVGIKASVEKQKRMANSSNGKLLNVTIPIVTLM